MKQIIPGGYYDLLNATTVEYNTLVGRTWLTTENQRQHCASAAGTLSRLLIKLDDAPGAGKSYTVVVMKNGVATDLSVTIADAETSGSNTVNTVAIAGGDVIGLRCTPSGTPTARYARWSIQFEGTTAKQSWIPGGALGVTTGTRYAPLTHGAPSAITTENDARQVIPTAGKIKNLYVNGDTNPGGGTEAYRFTLRVDGVDTALTCDMTGAATTANDTTNEVTVAAGDVVTLSIVRVDSPTSNVICAIGYTFVADTDGESLVLGGSNNALSASATEYNYPSSLLIGMVWTATEAQRYQGAQPAVFKNLYVLLSDSPGAGKSYAIGIRQNGVTRVSATIADAATTGNNTTDTFTAADLDDINMISVPSDTPTARDAYWGFVGYIEPVVTTTITPPKATLTLTTFAPTVTVFATTVITPPAATLTLTTFAPTVTATFTTTFTPPALALTLATFAPTILLTQTIITPPRVALTLTTFAPLLVPIRKRVPVWYNTSWSRRLKITIDHTKVDSDLYDFPVLICGEQITDDRFWFIVTGADIVVTKDDGKTKLKRELVSIDTSAKTLELYVRVPVVSSTVDTVLYLYYGNPAGAETNDTDTWIAAYNTVLHMNDNPADDTQVLDSTANANTGTKGAAWATAAANLSNGTGTLDASPTSIAAGTGGTTVTVTAAGTFTITIPANQYLIVTKGTVTSVSINFPIVGARTITVVGTGTFTARWLGVRAPSEETGYFTGDKAQQYIRSNVISIADDAGFLNDPPSITISGVFYIDPTSAGLEGLLVHKETGSAGRGTYVLHLDTSNRLNIQYRNAANNANHQYRTAETPFGWCHLAGTLVYGDGAQAALYINGQPVSGSWTVGDGSALPMTANNPLYLGSDSAGLRAFIGKYASLSISSIRSADWIAATYQSLLGYATFLTVEYDSTVWSALALPPARTEYTIQIRDNNGNQQGVFKDVSEASLDQSVNNPAVLSLNCPLSSQTSQLLGFLQRPYEVWVLKDGEPIFSGPINLRDDSHRESASLHLDVLDYLQSLKKEFVELYDGNVTVAAHVEAFLAMQVNTRPVLLGTIEPTLIRDITIEKAYIYESIMNLQSLNVGGYIQVDYARKLHWYNQLSESTGQQIRYGKNLKGITRTFDWLNFGNRLYIYGDGIDLTDAGYATTYIDDAASIATYDYSVLKFIEPLSTVAKPGILLDYANWKLKQSSQPKISYTVDIVNLEYYGRDFEELNLGSWVQLIDEELDIDTTVQIVRVVRDLIQPQNIQIELSASPSTITDFDIGTYY